MGYKIHVYVLLYGNKRKYCITLYAKISDKTCSKVYSNSIIIILYSLERRNMSWYCSIIIKVTDFKFTWVQVLLIAACLCIKKKSTTAIIYHFIIITIHYHMHLIACIVHFCMPPSFLWQTFMQHIEIARSGLNIITGLWITKKSRQVL